MNYRKVTAIFRMSLLEKVERKLQELGVKGFSISKVKGYGEYADFYAKDWLTNHARIEIFLDEKDAEVTAQAIMDAASLDLEGDGIVAIVPVEKLYRIRTKTEIVDEG
ncbi:MAG: P-II family nitrogen regulator [Gammaproteobacteria bacterium]|nr:P-II family nitrogen regulator [Gammaproteobacteria bacterium]